MSAKFVSATVRRARQVKIKWLYYYPIMLQKEKGSLHTSQVAHQTGA